MDVQYILRKLPHRYPFLLVDRVLELEKDVRIKALKNVTINEPFFTGHFPGFPIMPGVLIVEAMAQAGGFLAMHILGESVGDRKVFFLTIDRARFRKPGVPGDQLRFEIDIERRRGTIWRVEGKAFVGHPRVRRGAPGDDRRGQGGRVMAGIHPAALVDPGAASAPGSRSAPSR